MKTHRSWSCDWEEYTYQSSNTEDCQQTPEAGRGGERVSPRALREQGPAQALTSDLWPPDYEIINFFFKPRVSFGFITKENMHFSLRTVYNM